MQIISALPIHYPIINSIAHITWRDTYPSILSKTQFNYMLEKFYSLQSITVQVKNNNLFYMLQHKNEYIGFASCQININNTNKTKVHKLYILPQAQGLGAGNTLINYIKNIALQNNNNALVLNVNRFNKAKDFYIKLGFVITQSIDIEIGNGYLMEDYIMELALQ